MNEEAILLLYNDLKETYDVGSIDDFKNYLMDDNKKQMFFDQVIKPTYNVDDIETFNEVYGLKKKDESTFVAPKKDVELVTEDTSLDTQETPETTEYQPQNILEPIESEDSEFEASLKTSVTPEMIADVEEFVVPEMQYKFGKYGFDFEEANILGDEMRVKVRGTNKELKVPLDRLFFKETTSKELEKFLRENKRKESEILKQSQAIVQNQRTIQTDEELNATIKLFNKESERFVYEANEYAKAKAKLDSIYESNFSNVSKEQIKNNPVLKANYGEWLKQSNQLDLKLKDIEGGIKDFRYKGAKLDRIAGEYTAMKAEQGTWWSGFWNKMMGESGSTFTPISLLIDLGTYLDEKMIMGDDTDASVPVKTRKEEYKKDIIKIAKEKGLAPEGLNEDMSLDEVVEALGGDTNDVKLFFDSIVTKGFLNTPSMARARAMKTGSTEGGIQERKKTNFDIVQDALLDIERKTKKYYEPKVDPSDPEGKRLISARERAFTDAMSDDPKFRNPFSVVGAQKDNFGNEGMVSAGRRAYDFLKDKSTTEQWIEVQEQGNFLKKGFLGLGGSLPAMLGTSTPAGWAQRTVQMYNMSTDYVDREMEKNPMFDKISEAEKTLVKMPIGIATAVLENIGLRNIIAQKGLLNSLVSKALRKSNKNTTAKTFQEFIRQDVQSMIGRGALVVTGAGLAEFETGFAQEIAAIEIKDVYNASKESKMFETPETFAAYMSQVVEAGLAEMVGGFIMGSIPAVTTAVSGLDVENLDPKVFEIFENTIQEPTLKSTYISGLKNRIADPSNELDAKEAQKELDLVNKLEGIMIANRVPFDEFNTNQRKEALQLLLQKETLDNEIQEADKVLSKPKQELLDRVNKRLEELTRESISTQEETKLESEGITELDSTLEEGDKTVEDTEVEVTPEEETDVKEERYNDSQIPVSQQKFTVENDNDETITVEVTTQLDGSRKIQGKLEDGVVFFSETVSKDNTLTNEDYVSKAYGDVKSTEEVDIKTVINPKLESRMSDRQRKAAGLDVTPEAEVEVDDEVVYEMNKTNKRTWSKDFEILDNRKGQEQALFDEEGNKTSDKWWVVNKVTGQIIEVGTKTMAKDVIANAPAYAESFGDGTKVGADMIVTPAPAPAPKAEVKVEEQVEVTPEGNERVNQVVELSPNFREDNGEIIMGGLSVKVKDLLAMTDDKFNAFVKDVTKRFKLKTPATPQTDPEISRLENEIEDDQMSVETFQEEITIEKDNFREEVARIKEEKAKIRKDKKLSKEQRFEAIEEKIAEQEDLKEEMDGVIESYRDDMKQKQSEIRKAKRAIEKIKKKASSKPRKQVTKVEKKIDKETQEEQEDIKEFFIDELGESISPNLNINKEGKPEKVNNLKPRIIKIAKASAKAIAKLLPKTKIVLHESKSEYFKYTGKKGRGYYDTTTDTIHIDLTNAKLSTVPHEVFHAVFLNKLKTDAKARAMAIKMVESVKKTLPKTSKLYKEIDAFSKLYTGEQAQFQEEEFIAELIGLMSSQEFKNYKQLKAPAKYAIVEFLKKIAKKFGIKLGSEFGKDDQSVIDLINVLATKTVTGEEITEQDVEILDDGTTPIGSPTEIKAPEGRQSKIIFKDSYDMSLVTPKYKVDLLSLIDNIIDNEEKVWFWVADQLGLGDGMDAGPSFALQPENIKKKTIWASGLDDKKLNRNIDLADYIFIISGSPETSKLFNKKVFDKYKKGLGDYNLFKEKALETNPVKAIKETLQEFDSWDKMRKSPKRKTFLIAVNEQSKKPNTKFHKLVKTLGGFVDLQSLRDGFYRENNFLQNDIMLVLKPTGLGGKSNHSTYSTDILGEVVGVPDVKLNAEEIMPQEIKDKISGKNISEKTSSIAPYGGAVSTAVKEISQPSIREQKSVSDLESNLKEKYDVTLDLYQNKDFLELDKIIVTEDQRNTGVGSNVMREVIDFANKKGLTIALTPSTSYGATSIDRLKGFYKGLGFVENKGINKDFTTKQSMLKLPEVKGRESKIPVTIPADLDQQIDELKVRIEAESVIEFQKDKAGKEAYTKKFFDNYQSLKDELKTLELLKEGLVPAYSQRVALAEKLNDLNKPFMKEVGNEFYPRQGTVKKGKKIKEDKDLGGVFEVDASGYLFRGVSRADFNRVRSTGIIDTDLRGAISEKEGINLAPNASTAFNYLPEGVEGVVMAIKVDKDMDLFMIGADDYVRSSKPIPYQNVKVITTPTIEGRYLEIKDNEVFKVRGYSVNEEVQVKPRKEKTIYDIADSYYYNNGYFEAKPAPDLTYLRREVESVPGNYSVKKADGGGLFLTENNRIKKNLSRPKGREQKSTQQIINEGRQANFKESNIRDFLVRVLNRSSKEVDELMSLDKDFLEVVPKSFTNIKGGIKAGTKLYNRVEAYRKKLVKRNDKLKGNKKLTSTQIVDKTIEYLQKQPEYINEGDKYTVGSKKKGTQETRVRKGFSTQQARMLADYTKTAGVRPTNNMGAKIRKAMAAVRQKVKGAKDLQKQKTALRNFIRQSLPKALYTKKDAIDLVNKVNDVNAGNIENLMKEVIEFVNKTNVKSLQSQIKSILNKKYSKVESGRKKPVKISDDIRKRIDFINSIILNDKATPVQIGDALINLQNRFNELAAEVNQTEDTRSEMVDLELAMMYINTLQLEDTNETKVEQLDKIVQTLKEMIEDGRSQLKEQIREQHLYYLQQFELGYEAITGNKIDMNEPDAFDELNKMKKIFENEKAKRNTQNVIKKFLRSLKEGIDRKAFGSAEDLFSLMDRLDKLPGEMYGGNLQEMFTERVDEASRLFKGRMMLVEQLIQEHLKEVYGKKWNKQSRQNRLAKDTGIMIQDGLPLSPKSQNQIAYLYNMYKDPANRKSFSNPEMYGIKTIPKDATKAERESIQALNEENAERVMSEMIALLDPKVKETADWQVNELYPFLYNHYNDAYKKLYRTDLPWSEFYSGTIYREGVDQEESSILDLQNARNIYSTAVGASGTKVRENSNKAIKTMDMMDVLNTYLNQMEYFAAYGEVVRDMSKLFNNKYISDAITKIHGKDVYKYTLAIIDKIASRGTSSSFGNTFINAMNNVFILSRLAISPVIMIKQLTSFITYANDIGPLNYLKYAAKNKVEMMKVYKEIRDNSVYMKDRQRTSIMRAIETYSDANMKKFVPAGTKDWIVNFAMWTTKFGDKSAIYLGGMPNYSYYKAQFKKKNPEATEQEAIDHAVRLFERDTKRTQQSGDLQDKDYYQTKDPLYRGLNMFLTTPKQYLRKEIVAIRNLNRKLSQWDSKAGKGTVAENLRTFFMYHVIMPVFFQYVSMGLPGILRDERDDDKLDLLRAAMIGNLNALFIVGDLFQMAGDFFTGKPWAGSNIKTVGILSIAGALTEKFAYAAKLKDPAKKSEAYQKAYLELATLTGVPAPTIAKFVENYGNIGKDGDIGKDILRLLNFSKYQIEGPGKGGRPKKIKTIQELNEEYDKKKAKEQKSITGSSNIFGPSTKRKSKSSSKIF